MSINVGGNDDYDSDGGSESSLDKLKGFAKNALFKNKGVKVAVHSFNFLVSTGFVVIDVDNNKAVPDYIYYILNQQEITEHLQDIAEQSVSTYPSIKPSDIENLEVIMPDIDTQKRIVSILDTIDRKITQNEKINNNLPTHRATYGQLRSSVGRH